MKTTYPTGRRCQSWATWKQYINEQRGRVSEHIASLEVTTAIWRNVNPRRERCERSWSQNK